MIIILSSLHYVTAAAAGTGAAQRVAACTLDSCSRRHQVGGVRMSRYMYIMSEQYLQNVGKTAAGVWN